MAQNKRRATSRCARLTQRTGCGSLVPSDRGTNPAAAVLSCLPAGLQVAERYQRLRLLYTCLHGWRRAACALALARAEFHRAQAALAAQQQVRKGRRASEPRQLLRSPGSALLTATVAGCAACAPLCFAEAGAPGGGGGAVQARVGTPRRALRLARRGAAGGGGSRGASRDPQAEAGHLLLHPPQNGGGGDPPCVLRGAAALGTAAWEGRKRRHQQQQRESRCGGRQPCAGSPARQPSSVCGRWWRQGASRTGVCHSWRPPGPPCKCPAGVQLSVPAAGPTRGAAGACPRSTAASAAGALL